MSPRKLKILCDYAQGLVQLRQAECKHLAIENIGPAILADVLKAHDGNYHPQYVFEPSGEMRQVV